MAEVGFDRPTMKYRADIDGLRAIAVVSVMSCHMEIGKMAGGFVGVDVFFVISGYLISSIIFAEIDNSRFSILSFYERRIRRIFPALFGMLSILTIVAVICFLPIELVDYSKSLAAATASLSNFYFWQHSGYFDSPTSKPLLHTWSLAVEEQFYILFPIFLLLIRRVLPNRLRVSVVLLFLASLLLSIIVVHVNRDTAFYMSYTRAWELLLGTMLSLRMFPRTDSICLRNLTSVLGIGMIVYSIFSYSRFTLFPGLAALVPCIGSVLVIGSGESGSSLIGSFLSWRPIVQTGLISYSLYLWHWPVIILHKMGILFPMGIILPRGSVADLSPTRYSHIVEIVISFCIALLSWRFVERPFRTGSLRLAGKPLFALAGGGMLLSFVISTSAIVAGGFHWRFSPRSVQLAAYLENDNAERTMRAGTCFITSGNHFEDYVYSQCLHQEEQKTNWLLLGDSHSAVLWSALSSAFPGANIMQANASSCAPFVNSSGTPDCKKLMTYIYQGYLPSHSIQGLLLECRWGFNDVVKIADTIKWARDHQIRVILFGPIPEYDAALPRLEAYSIAWDDPHLVSQHRIKGSEQLDEQLQRLATTTWHISYIFLYRAICNNGSCTEYADSEHRVPLMFDDNHLSPPGSLLVINRLVYSGDLMLDGADSNDVRLGNTDHQVSKAADSMYVPGTVQA